MKELEMRMINELISLYNNYIAEGLTDNIKIRAKELESRYLNTSAIVGDVVTNAKGKLTYFYAPIKPGPINKKEAKKIIEDLKKRIKELESCT